MAKTIYRIKGTIKAEKINDVLNVISNFSDLTFHLDMTKKDRKNEKQFQKGRLVSLPKDFGTKRHIMCSGENFAEIRKLHESLKKYLLKDTSDQELL